MINKKIIFGIFIINFLGACSSPTAMLGPVYTLTSTGNIYQAGLSYGSNEFITNYTGKTPIENLQEVKIKKTKQNIQKRTLESDDFYQLVKNKVEKTSEKLKIISQ
tara:strand:- start:215 stop:532 length:318 start_codon:yes stop_codon:yes gene_type:complete